MDFPTLQDFYTHTKGIAYLLMVVALLGLAAFWVFLTGRDKGDKE